MKKQWRSETGSLPVACCAVYCRIAMQNLSRPVPPDYRVQMQLKGFDRCNHEVDVCVVGGGMAGMIAAIAAARGGAKVALVHDRAVLGGNASSEIRMWICGAHGANNKETGILEEIQLENCYRNPAQIYSIWDSVLYEKVAFCPGLTLLLNTTCVDAKMEDGRVASVSAWQLTSQTWHTIHAKVFIDCSGDSVLAPLTGALVRVGREAASEFGEDIEPAAADSRTMGNTLLIQMREMDRPQRFVAPRWAYKFTSPSDFPNRGTGVKGNNWWWFEVGGLNDTIRDAEAIRDELMRIGYGIIDYVKNHDPRKGEHENWTLEWMGSLPGKRENRRYVGEHILTQNDVRAGGRFDDIIAYGGWSMDDHHPAGLYYPGQPTIFHPAPSPFGIPYRCLYSVNVPNLMFAGRNISTTHAALSATRVMGTTSLLGQATGTAASIAIARHCDPRGVPVADLQAKLMDDDQWLPGKSRAVSELTQRARVTGGGRDTEALRDGHDRPIGDVGHRWQGSAGDAITWRFAGTVLVGGLRLVFDSDLNQHKRMPCSVPLSGNRCGVPTTIIRKFRVEAQGDDGAWRTVCREDDNYQRLVRIPLSTRAKAIRLVPEENWGDTSEMTLFGADILDGVPQPIGVVPDGEAWSDVVRRIAPADLARPHAEENPRQNGEDMSTQTDYRPIYHVTPASGWVNDPNGLVYFRKQWHLFYQYFNGDECDGMQWGHAVSSDLAQWERRPTAISIDALGHIWSGSAVGDHNNTSGLFKDGPGIVCIYTYWDPADGRQCQGLAYSQDGVTFTKYSGNPIIPQLRHLSGQPDDRDFRDPKVFWHEPTGRWVMIAAGGKVRFFSSPDLLHWRFESINEDIETECPDLFELSVDGDSRRKVWVLSGAGKWCMLGAFDGRRFSPSSARLPFGDGPDCYATQTWSDAPNGRRIAISWLFNWNFGSGVRQGKIHNPFPTDGWAGGSLSVPVELVLKTMAEGVRMVQTPVREVESLRRPTTVSLRQRRLETGAEVRLTDSAVGAWDVALTADGSADACISIAAGGDRGEAWSLVYDCAQSKLLLMRSSKKLAQIPNYNGSFELAMPKGQGISLRLLIDRCSVEIFAADGRIMQSIFVLAAPDGEPVTLRMERGDMTIKMLDVYPMATGYRT